MSVVRTLAIALQVPPAISKNLLGVTLVPRLESGVGIVQRSLGLRSPAVLGVMLAMPALNGTRAAELVTLTFAKDVAPFQCPLRLLPSAKPDRPDGPDLVR